jgi:DNA-binding transcriptional LysR family regulator
MKLDGVQAFVAIAEAGSISEAARRLSLSKSVVSERLAELERSLGARLAQRTTRKMSLTEDGLALLERGRRILREAEDASAEIAERRGALVGPLRISAPVSFGVLHLGSALYRFLDANPGIQLSLDLDDRFVDAETDGYDAVVRHGPVRDSRLVALRLASSARFLVASPAYLARNGHPRTLAELRDHRGIVYSNRDADWRFPGPNGAAVVRPAAALRVNNGLMMRDAALAGLGIALLPSFIVHDALASGALRIVDPGRKPEGAEVYIAYPVSRRNSAKVRAMTEHLRGAFGNPPYWEAAASRRAKSQP